MKNSKTDMRFRKTEKAIRKALHELLQEKDLSHITVKELVERAEINKTTFYAHYETLPDLIETLELENIDYIIENLDQVELLYRDPDLFIENLYHNLMDCKILLISKNIAGNSSFIRKLKDRIDQNIHMKQINPKNYQEITATLIFVFHGVMGIANTKMDSDIALDTMRTIVKSGITGKSNLIRI